MMSMRNKLGIVSHNQQQVPCLSMRSKRNNQQKQRQRQRALALTATQLVTTTGKEYKEKSGSLNDYPQFQHKDINTQRKSARKLSDVWREVQGSNNWEGMLEPMDHLLRSELIKYGELAQACYDAFDFDHHSSYCGSCKYNRRTMLQDLGLSHSGYEITKYLYATSNINLPNFFKKSRAGEKLWSNHANWMGFVAVAENDEEAPALVWSGWQNQGFSTSTPPPRKTAASPNPARRSKFTQEQRLIEMYKGEKLSITITGHSLGSALAMLSAYDIAEMGINWPQSSPSQARGWATLPSGSASSSSGSSDPCCSHNLEAHLTSYIGQQERFHLATGRDPALVNKAADFLQDYLHIPPCWRQDHNKGMVRNARGRWVQLPRTQSHLL